MEHLPFIIEKIEELGLTASKEVANLIAYLWPIYLLRVTNVSIGTIVFAVFLSVTALILWVKSSKFECCDSMQFGRAVAITMWLISVCITLYQVTNLMNVEYGALNLLLRDIKFYLGR